MDAPPEQEDCLPFVTIAGYLETIGVTAPRVVQANLDEGFLLLSDLGSTSYLDVFNASPERADGLYADAISALLALQRGGVPFRAQLPPYDETLLRFELSLFRDWLCGRHLELVFDSAEAEQWRVLCDRLVGHALQQPRTFVHRDYHSRNLMLVDDGNPGILDFQDAVDGPYTYDLVSLLKDCYVKWPLEQVNRWALSFYQQSRARFDTAVSEDEFIRDFELMGVQRQLKAAGIFARLMHRDGKSTYMQDVPRTLSYISDIADRYPELGFLANLIRERILPELEVGG